MNTTTNPGPGMAAPEINWDLVSHLIFSVLFLLMAAVNVSVACRFGTPFLNNFFFWTSRVAIAILTFFIVLAWSEKEPVIKIWIVIFSSLFAAFTLMASFLKGIPDSTTAWTHAVFSLVLFVVFLKEAIKSARS